MTKPPVQRFNVPEAETEAVGGVFTVTAVEEDVAEQLPALVTVTV